MEGYPLHVRRSPFLQLSPQRLRSHCVPCWENTLEGPGMLGSGKAFSQKTPIGCTVDRGSAAD